MDLVTRRIRGAHAIAGPLLFLESVPSARLGEIVSIRAGAEERRGQIIDEKIKAALDRMKEKTAVGQLQELAVTTQVKTAQNKERVRWYIAAGSALFLISIVIVWRLARRRTMSLLPAPIPSGPLERSPLDADPVIPMGRGTRQSRGRPIFCRSQVGHCAASGCASSSS